MKEQLTLEQFCQEHGLPEPTQIIGKQVKITFLPLEEQKGERVEKDISKIDAKAIQNLLTVTTICKIENLVFHPTDPSLSLCTNLHHAAIGGASGLRIIGNVDREIQCFFFEFETSSKVCFLCCLRVKIKWL